MFPGPFVMALQKRCREPATAENLAVAEPFQTPAEKRDIGT